MALPRSWCKLKHSKSEKSSDFSEIETMLTFFVEARLGAFLYSINCLVFFTICATRTQPAAPRTRKSQIIYGLTLGEKINEIFEEQLDGWYRVPEAWPTKRECDHIPALV